MGLGPKLLYCATAVWSLLGLPELLVLKGFEGSEQRRVVGFRVLCFSPGRRGTKWLGALLAFSFLQILTYLCAKWQTGMPYKKLGIATSFAFMLTSLHGRCSKVVAPGVELPSIRTKRGCVFGTPILTRHYFR